MATTTKVGSRRANCPIQSQLVRQQRTAANMPTSVGLSWNGCYPNTAMSNKWRASLVPAAAVIPAPLVYTNIAAVKTLVVCHWDSGLAHGWLAGFARLAGYNLRQYVPDPNSNDAERLLHEVFFSEGQSYLAVNACLGDQMGLHASRVTAHNRSTASEQPW